MAPLLVQKATGAGTVSWVAPGDLSLVGAGGPVGTVLSTDPSLTSALMTTPAADGFTSSVLFYTSAGGNFSFPTPIPIKGGETYYAAFVTKGTLLLFFADP